MKKKINTRLVLMSILAILLTVLSVTYVYYGLFQDQVKSGLKTEARLLSKAGMSNIVDNKHFAGDEDIRITWISKKGKVLFDNDTDAKKLGNHLNRPEVKNALINGEGESIRESDTMKLKTFYYALKLKDGTVIRVATEARSMYSVFLSAFPMILMVLLVVLLLCMVLSHMLTDLLLLPVKELAEDIESTPVKPVYKELEPFIDRIREQHENILAAAKNKQDFSTNVSHELKTPITAISGYAELIENQMVDETTQIKFAGDIRRNANSLVEMINDIIRLSHLDESDLSPNYDMINIYEVLEDRLEFLRKNASDKNIDISLTGTDFNITADKGMMVELIDNLVQNAIRYNVENGSVMVSLKPYGNRCFLTVEDTGIGIPEDELEKVYERFYTVDKSRSKENGGTGLGLAIVKHIVDIHGGDIKLESELGKGTKVTVKL